MPDAIRDMDIEVKPVRKLIEATLNDFVAHTEKTLERARADSRKSTNQSEVLILVIVVIALLLAGALAFVLTRTLGQLYRKVHRAKELREEMLSIVAHDLRNPLTAIKLGADSLKRIPLPEENRARVQRTATNIENSSARMNRLIQDLLDVDKIDTGHLVLDLKKEKVTPIIDEVLEVMKPAALERHIDIINEAQDFEEEILCDKDRVFQALSNLIGNATKFTAEGGRITIGVQKTGRGLHFSVAVRAWVWPSSKASWRPITARLA